jgi:hypothetical protein
MMPINEKSRISLTVLLTVLGIACGVLGTVFFDRLGVETRVTRVESRVEDQSSRITSLEVNAATHIEIQELEKRLDKQHDETITQIRDLYKLVLRTHGLANDPAFDENSRRQAVAQSPKKEKQP